MRRLVIISAALIGLGLAAYLLQRAADAVYFAERRQLVAQIKTTSARLSEYQKARIEHKRVQSEIQGYVDRTLGGNLETVDHKLRTRLNRLGESAGLQDYLVDTSKFGRDRESPAKTEFSRSGFQRLLRDEIDFVELEAWVTGSGTLEQCLKLIDAIDSEHWLKRIDQLTLNPSDNGNKFQFEVRMTSLFLPKRDPNPEAIIRPVSSNGQRYATLLNTNLFRLPPPAPAAAKVQAASPERFPFGQWILTGIAQSAAGAEIWLLNQQSRETRVLNIGQRIDEMMLASVSGESAVFLIGPDRYSVAVGKNLNDRTPLKQ